MARRSSKRTTKSNKKRARRFRLARLLPSARTRRRLVKLVRRTPPAVQVLLAAVAVVSVWLVVNWGYQVVRKPSELFFPVSEPCTRSRRKRGVRTAPCSRSTPRAS